MVSVAPAELVDNVEHHAREARLGNARVDQVPDQDADQGFRIVGGRDRSHVGKHCQVLHDDIPAVAELRLPQAAAPDATRDEACRRTCLEDLRPRL